MLKPTSCSALTLLVVCAGLLTGCGANSSPWGAQLEGTNGPTAPSTALQAPQIVQQPQNATVSDGSPVSFSVVASGTGALVYQWLINGQGMPGGTGSTLVMRGAALAQTGSLLSVIVRNTAGSATSRSATLTVTAVAPSISTQPTSQTVVPGATASFSVVAKGSAPLAFQWNRNGVVIAGANTANYVTPAASLSDSGSIYTVTVSNGVGSVTSNNATLTVSPVIVAPTIVTPPQNVTVPFGGTASFSVTASGTQPLTYQWTRNAANIAGATGTSYTVTPALPQDNGAQFAVVVTNAAGSATSQPATLTVSGPAVGVALLAGQLGGSGSIDGAGAGARFYAPAGIATDAAGNVYVADSTRDIIRQVSPNGVVTTIAGTAEIALSSDGIGTNAYFTNPGGVAVDPSGNLYVADTGNDTIRLIQPNGTVSTIAGTAGNVGNSDGTGNTASFNAPGGIATDAAGNVYIADTGNNTIRKMTPAGAVSTLAGTAGVVGSQDGTGAGARFNAPEGLTVDAAGNVFVADTLNNTIREITPTGVVTTIAGTAGVFGLSDGPGASAQFGNVYGIAIDASGNLYVSDLGGMTIRMISAAPQFVVSTIAGNYLRGTVNGPEAQAEFNVPRGVALDGGGNIYVSDYGDNTIRKLSSGLVTTLAGLQGQPGSTDATGPAASFNGPLLATCDNAGNVYVADVNNNTIRKITLGGVATTLAGTAGVTGSADGSASSASFNAPVGIVFDGMSALYVTDSGNNTIRKVTLDGVVSTVAGSVGTTGSVDGNGSAASFNGPTGIATDGQSNFYVTDTGNNTIRRVTAAGAVATIAGTAGVTGTLDGAGAAAQFNAPQGIASDGAGNLYVADTGNSTIRAITQAGVVTTLAGNPASPGPGDGVGSAANFLYPEDITLDNGVLYVSDTVNMSIRQVTTAGAVTTVVGAPRSEGVILGALPGSLNNPYGIASIPGVPKSLIVTTAVENSILLVTFP
ncbi:MAG TPA: immunoglobulin domain-containing protein [Steroidobacteraceae bacterium]|nr:immunoglobulin domain-containing protein [Steroidobacteraceae bacterium]